MDIRAQAKLIGNILVSSGLIKQAQLDNLNAEIEKEAELGGEDFETLIINRGFVSEQNLLSAYARYFNFPFVELEKISFDPRAVSLVPAKFANKNKLIAFRKEPEALLVALRNPFDVSVIDELRVICRVDIKPALATRDDIEKAIKLYYGVGAETVERLVKGSILSGSAQTEMTFGISQAAEDSARDSSIINYVNQLLLEAHRLRATDIHIEPFEQILRIRYRIDGVLYVAQTPGDIKKLQAAIISRLKIMANLNIAEKRRPQDGRCKINLEGEEIDLRLSSFPTLFGEGLSIRFLPTKSIFLSLEELGFESRDYQQYKRLLSKPNGVILVTGPTGCGKTTTLYASLNYLNNEHINIVTLEDPIEYQLQGINQIQINPRIDLTFASGLRSILRQDPNIIMVGEIRDFETAQIAIRAALTGHLIFTTLHTNDAASTITRLVNIGIEPYLIASTIKGIVAQRLVRRICQKCKVKDKPDMKLLKALGFKGTSATKVSCFKGKGCPACNNTGYKGRIGVFELLVIEGKLASLIVEGGYQARLQQEARALGMKSLREDSLLKVLAGLTTLAEAVRVTEGD